MFVGTWWSEKWPAEDGRCEKNDNYSVVDHPIWMMNILF